MTGSDIDDMMNLDDVPRRKAPPSQAETRELRRQYRHLYADVDASKNEFLKNDPSSIMEVMNQANSLYKNVHSTAEAALDHKLLVLVADLTSQRASKMRLAGTVLEVDDFLSKVLVKLGGDPSNGDDNQRRKRKGGGDGNGLNWSAIGQIATKHYAEAPAIDFMLGPLGVVPKPKKDKKATVRIKKDPKLLRTPQELREEDIEKQVNETSKIVRSLHALLQEEEEVNFFKFFINPQSFSQTVENLFYVAFLMKDGDIEIFNKDDGHPYIRLVPEDEDESDTDQESRKVQLILEITEDMWKALIRKYGITTSFIPTRAPVVSAAQGSKWYG